MRKGTIQEQMQEYRESITGELERWKHINKNGCNDPFWPDGCNMNLVRNHIIYYKCLVAQVCEENGSGLPDEYYLPTPPAVDTMYMANLNQDERIQRFKHEGRKLTTRKMEYDESQLSLL